MSENKTSQVEQSESASHNSKRLDIRQTNWLVSVAIFFRFHGEGGTAFVMAPLNGSKKAAKKQFFALIKMGFRLVGVVVAGVNQNNIVLGLKHYSKKLEEGRPHGALTTEAAERMRISAETEREVLGYLNALSIAAHDAQHGTDQSPKMERGFSLSGKTLTPVLRVFFKEQGKKLHDCIHKQRRALGIGRSTTSSVNPKQ